MQAVILAAGMGKRLGKLTSENTKCMLQVHGRTLLERALDIILDTNINRVILVIGFKGDKLKALIGDNYKGLPVEYIENDVYYKTNNIYSLFLAREKLLEDDTLLLESDLIFEAKIIHDLLNNKLPNLAVVAKYESWMDGSCVILDDEDNLLQLIPKKDFKFKKINRYYKTVNIYKFSRTFSEKTYIPFLEAYSSALGNNEYYEQVLRIILHLDKHNLKAHLLRGEKWYEIDDIQDLNNANTLFAPRDQQLDAYQKRWGGYWRFPQLKDFCYLVNPWFPGKYLRNEIKCYFPSLLGEYPSGQNVQRLLAAKMFHLDQQNLLVGNGAAELIQALMPLLKAKIGIIQPTFQEYPNRRKPEDLFFINSVTEEGKSGLNIEKLLNFSESVESLILINPDNPSGHFYKQKEILILLKELKKQAKRLILDESFIDFAESADTESLLKEEILNQYPNLVIIKSISKSYGVPGIRLGIAASSDKDFISELEKGLSIWNINSFAEFFMQIFSKYKQKYQESCIKMINERERFYAQLAEIPFLEVYPSQANYFLLRITEKFKAKELSSLLLNDYELLVKDCTGKPGLEKGEYLRVAVRDSRDNQFLINALKKIQGSC